MVDFDLVCVDFQVDFAHEVGRNFNKGKSVNFIKNTLFPYLIDKKIKVSEIVSDYRLPRGKSKSESCVPGTKGFESLLPDELRNGKPWIKCMHNPLWIREYIGVPDTKIGNPYQDPDAFNLWVKDHLTHKKVFIFGLTTECCVLQVATELYYRGFDVCCIYEATDPMNERLHFKDEILNHSSFAIYANTISFKEFVKVTEDK